MEQEKEAVMELLEKAAALEQQILQLGKDELNAAPQVRKEVEQNRILIAELQNMLQLLEKTIEHEASQRKDTSQLSQRYELVKKLLKDAQQVKKGYEKQAQEQEAICTAIADLKIQHAEVMQQLRKKDAPGSS